MSGRLIVSSCLLASLALAAPKTPFTATEMMKLKRISEPSVAPDGHAVVFTVGVVDVEKNTQLRQVWLVKLHGGTPHALTTEGRNTGARFSPDSKQIAWISTPARAAIPDSTSAARPGAAWMIALEIFIAELRFRVRDRFQI